MTDGAEELIEPLLPIESNSLDRPSMVLQVAGVNGSSKLIAVDRALLGLQPGTAWYAALRS